MHNINIICLRNENISSRKNLKHKILKITLKQQDKPYKKKIVEANFDIC